MGKRRTKQWLYSDIYLWSSEAATDVEHNDIVQEQDLEARRKLERKLVLKLDLMLLPFLSFMYLFSSLDRSSLGLFPVLSLVLQ